MTNPAGPRGFDNLERGAADVLEAMRLAGRLLRALAPLATEMRELQVALGELQQATQWQLPPGPPRGTDSAISPAVSLPPLPAVEPEPAPEPAIPDAVPAAGGARDRSSAPAATQGHGPT